MHKNLLRYIFADSTAVLADNYFFVFLALAATQIGASPTEIGLLLTAYAVPRLILLLPGGLVADKISTRVVMVTGNLAQAIMMMLLAAGFMSGDVTIVGLFIAALFFGMVDAFNLPAVTAAATRLVAKDKLFKANRLRDGVGSTFQTIGFFAPGLVVTLFGLSSTAWVGAALYVLSAMLFWSVQFTVDTEQAGASAKLLQGLSYAWRSTSIRYNLLVQAIAYFATAGPLIVGLLLLVDINGLDSILYSTILMFYSIGGVIGALLSSKFELTTRKAVVLLVEIPLLILILICMATIPVVQILCVCFMILGGYSVIAGIVSDTWRQHDTTSPLQGRVASVKILVNESMKTISRGLTGITVTIAGLNGMFWAAALVIFIAMASVAVSHRTQLLNSHSN